MVLISLYNFLYYWKNQNYVGAHTIGVSHCSVIARRLYNFTGKGDADPSLDPDYANKLRRECGSPLNPSTTVDMDPDQSSLSFDSHYFKIVSQNKGLFQSDATLLTNPQSAQMVEMLQHGRLFFVRFAQSMKKMGGIGVLTGDEGEIRKHCSLVNAWTLVASVILINVRLLDWY